MAELNVITGMVVGQYGEAVQLTIADDDGNAADISTYTSSITVTLRDPKALKTLSYTATFVTNGTNGQIQFTPASGDIDRPGTWEGQVKLAHATGAALTKVFEVVVEKRISAT